MFKNAAQRGAYFAQLKKEGKLQPKEKTDLNLSSDAVMTPAPKDLTDPTLRMKQFKLPKLRSFLKLK